MNDKSQNGPFRPKMVTKAPEPAPQLRGTGFNERAIDFVLHDAKAHSAGVGGHIDTKSFHFNKQWWPWPAPAGLVFLGDAIEKLGPAVFGSAWTGDEPITRQTLATDDTQVAQKYSRKRELFRAIAGACADGTLAFKIKHHDHQGPPIEGDPNWWSTRRWETFFTLYQMRVYHLYGNEPFFIYLDVSSLDSWIGKITGNEIDRQVPTEARRRDNPEDSAAFEKHARERVAGGDPLTQQEAKQWARQRGLTESWGRQQHLLLPDELKRGKGQTRR